MTVSAQAGETKATQSFLAAARAIRLFACVTSSDAPTSAPMMRLTSVVSESENLENAVLSSPTVGELSEVPPVSDTSIGAVPVTNAAPAAAVTIEPASVNADGCAPQRT